MGSRGLGSKSSSSKTPTRWELNSGNAKDYGIMLKKHSTKKVSAEALQKAYDGLDASLATINQFGVLVGLKPNELPKVVLHYGKHSNSAYGDANMLIYQNMDIVDKKTGEVFSPNAIINLYAGGLLESPDTAAHEMYHAFAAMWIQDNYSGKSERANAWIDNSFSKALCQQALKNMGSFPTEENWYREAQKIYRNDWEKNHPEHTYASSKGRGQYAETVTCTIQAALRYGEKNISQYGQEILKELRKEIKLWRKNRRK